MLRGYGASADAYHPTAPHPEGAGAELAVRQALADAGARPRHRAHQRARHRYAAGDAAEALMLLRVFGGAPPPVTAAKSVVGHALGAAGAIAAAFTVLALERGRCRPPPTSARRTRAGSWTSSPPAPPAPGDLALSLSFGFGGQNAALVLGRC
ncbi:hypothetical protein NKH77_27700 [Streptomyces sp. M19]